MEWLALMIFFFYALGLCIYIHVLVQLFIASLGLSKVCVLSVRQKFYLPVTQNLGLDSI